MINIFLRIFGKTLAEKIKILSLEKYLCNCRSYYVMSNINCNSFFMH